MSSKKIYSVQGGLMG